MLLKKKKNGNGRFGFHLPKKRASQANGSLILHTEAKGIFAQKTYNRFQPKKYKKVVRHTEEERIPGVSSHLLQNGA